MNQGWGGGGWGREKFEFARQMERKLVPLTYKRGRGNLCMRPVGNGTCWLSNIRPVTSDRSGVLHAVPSSRPVSADVDRAHPGPVDLRQPQQISADLRSVRTISAGLTRPRPILHWPRPLSADLRWILTISTGLTRARPFLCRPRPVGADLWRSLPVHRVHLAMGRIFECGTWNWTEMKMMEEMTDKVVGWVGGEIERKREKTATVSPD